MKTTDFDYTLPPALIAQHPAARRDASRLLCYNRDTDKSAHRRFGDILDLLQPGDILVRNNTRVIPARLHGKTQFGGAVEILLLRRRSLCEWDALAGPGKKAQPGARITFSPELACEVLTRGEGGMRTVRFDYEGVFEDILSRTGEMPLPPYITEKPADPGRYQTVYAKIDGSAAAPTAGLHFTPELLDALTKKGVRTAEVLLHVGLGTFRPVKSEDVSQHVMHSEAYEVSESAAAAVNAARKQGGRVVAVGTTSVRVLESASDADGTLKPGGGETDIFIVPGYTFKCTDALITNFHLPKSTLLMLVSAFIGREKALELYAEAVKKEYRFFSFGDACFFE